MSITREELIEKVGELKKLSELDFEDASNILKYLYLALKYDDSVVSLFEISMRPTFERFKEIVENAIIRRSTKH